MRFLEARLAKKFPDFSLDAAIAAGRGEFVSLLGPSGAGKTTALQLIAGILEGGDSRIYLGGRGISSLPPEKRGIGMVFQERLLFPHLNVFGNAAFGLRMRGRDPAPAMEALEAVHMEKFAGRPIGTLSGGEQQRVAIARAIAFRPKLLLLDEPLKELDAVVREKIKVELKNLQKKLGITAILVTHDAEEAFYLSDRIFMMDSGRIVQSGTPAEVFRKPANGFVKGYFSPYVLLEMQGGLHIARRTSFSATRSPKNKK